MAVYGEILNEEAYLCEVAGLSKKDLLENPEKVEAKVRKLLDQKFSSVSNAIAVFISILALSVGIVTIPFTFGLSIFLSVFFIASVMDWISTCERRKKIKHLRKIKELANKMKIKYEKYLVKHPEDNKCKEALKKITEMIIHIEKVERDVEQEKENKKIENLKTDYNEAINSFKNGTEINQNPYAMGLMLKMFSESDIIKQYKNSKDFEPFYLTASDYALEDYKSDIIDSVKNDDILSIYYDEDEYYFFSKQKSKIFLVFDNGVEWSSISQMKSRFSIDDKESMNGYIAIDKELGYFLLSEPPKGIERKPVIEKK